MLEVILTQDVDSLGNAGEVVRVKPGYGRNYLLPRGLALLATRGNKSQLEHQRKAIEAAQAEVRKQHEELAKKLEGTTVSIARKQGEDEKLFGSVSTKDIADALAQQGLEIDRKIVKLDGAIKSIGTHEVTVRFSQHVSVALKVNVVGV
jgi:large subunit ribosomal protein L9